MTTLTIKHFDILEYVKKAKEYGIKEEFAEYSARQIGQLADTVQEQKQEIDSLKHLEPATKKDLELVKLELQKEIINIESRLIKWVFGVGVSSVLVLCGAMFTMLKLMIHS